MPVVTSRETDEGLTKQIRHGNSKLEVLNTKQVHKESGRIMDKGKKKKNRKAKGRDPKNSLNTGRSR